MIPQQRNKQLNAARWLVGTLLSLVVGAAPPAHAQAPAPAAMPPAVAPMLNPGAVVRRVVLKDAASAEQFRLKLEQMKANGLFRDQLTQFDPKKPVLIEISFLTSGNYLLVVGSKDWVEANIESIRLMGYLYERPRAHLQLSLRVVQLTGPANADVIQMSETVRALVDAQREEIVRTFGDLQNYLVERFRQRAGTERHVFEAVKSLLPGLGLEDRPLTVPEILLLMMLDRTSPAPQVRAGAGDAGSATEAAFLDLQQVLALGLRDPHTTDEAIAKNAQESLAGWKKAVAAARDWSAHYAEQVKKEKDKDDKQGIGGGLGAFREALQSPDNPLPVWLSRRLQRSFELTERLYPSLLRRHTEQTLQELQRRFAAAYERAEALEKALVTGEMPPMPEPKKKGEAVPAPPEGRVRRVLVALKSLAEEMVPAPLAVFESVAQVADNSAPTAQQLIQMFTDYGVERKKLEMRLAGADQTTSPKVNYARLQSLEAGLNLWLRRVSESMARALEQQFYSRYVNELRLLANKQLGKSSSRDLLMETAIDEIPDVTRDLVLADSGVNIFLSNSISLQFAPETTNSVSAQVQSPLPSKQSLLERLQQAQAASSAVNALSTQFGINGEGIIKSLLAGGQAVPVQGGISLSASPSIGFDASTVTLSLTANQTLEPNNAKVADRVTNHSINNATITALSYEPMVLSTLASNVSFFETSGGIPILRKTPVLKELLKDLPGPLKEKKRQKGVYQSSVIILEPVVIPTIEDLIRFHGGWQMAALTADESELDK